MKLTKSKNIRKRNSRKRILRGGDGEDEITITGKRYNKNDESLELLGKELDLFPEEIFQFTELKKLFLNNNKINKLPDNISQLRDLTSLTIANNRLTSLPPNIVNLRNLRYLDLIGNPLTNLPNNIENLRNLERLKLGGNNLIESIVKLSTGIISLINLDLNNSDLETLPDEIGNLENLTSLTITKNKLTSLPPDIDNLINLERLDLDDNSLTFLPPNISNLRNLKVLDLSNNILDKLPINIGNLRNLEVLYVHLNRLDELPDSIIELRNLQVLVLSNNRLTELPDSIRELTNLTHLYLDNNHITRIPEWIENLRNLETLDLTDNPIISGFPETIGRLRLTELEGEGYYERVEEEFQPAGIAYEIHNMFDDFDKQKYEEKLRTVLTDNILREIEDIRGEHIGEKYCNYLKKLLLEVDIRPELITSNINMIELICDKVKDVEIDPDSERIILLTFKLLDWLNSKKLKTIYFDVCLSTSVNAYDALFESINHGHDASIRVRNELINYNAMRIATSCAKGLIERSILSFTKLLTDMNGICSNNLESIDDLEEEKKKFLLSLCRMYNENNINFDKQELIGMIRNWLESVDYQNMNTENRKNSCLDYVETNYINRFEENRREEIKKRVNEELNAYSWFCDDELELFIGCDNNTEANVEREPEVIIKEGDTIGGIKRRKTRKTKLQKKKSKKRSV